MNKTFIILSNIPGFSDLSETLFEEIKQIIVNRHYNKGEIIFSEGNAGI